MATKTDLAAQSRPLSAADKLPPAKSTVHRTSADRLKLATGLNDARRR